MLSPGKCHFVLFGFKENEQFDLICNDITLKRSCHEKFLGVNKRSLQIILNDYESPYSLLLEEAHKIALHQRCINSLMIEIYKYLNGHSSDIIKVIWD